MMSHREVTYLHMPPVHRDSVTITANPLIRRLRWNPWYDCVIQATDMGRIVRAFCSASAAIGYTRAETCLRRSNEAIETCIDRVVSPHRRRNGAGGGGRHVPL